MTSEQWPAYRGGGGVPQPGYRADDPLVISANWDDEEREGAWTLPPFVELFTGLGDIRLDCTQAVAAASRIDVALRVVLGDVTILVPPGWAADVDRVSGSLLGDKDIKVSREPEPGCPVLAVRGGLGLGELTIRHAGDDEAKRAAKELKRCEKRARKAERR